MSNNKELKSEQDYTNLKKICDELFTVNYNICHDDDDRIIITEALVTKEFILKKLNKDDTNEIKTAEVTFNISSDNKLLYDYHKDGGIISYKDAPGIISGIVDKKHLKRLRKCLRKINEDTNNNMKLTKLCDELFNDNYIVYCKDDDFYTITAPVTKEFCLKKLNRRRIHDTTVTFSTCLDDKTLLYECGEKDNIASGIVDEKHLKRLRKLLLKMNSNKKDEDDKKTYKFRAECSRDVNEFKNHLVNILKKLR